MIKILLRLATVTLTLFVLLFSTLPAPAKVVPLRTGEVVSTKDAKAYTYIKAVDGEGKEFWVLTAICVVGEGGQIEVIAGTHYDEIKSENLDTVFKDVYTAQLIRVNGKEINGFGGHDLPAGCVTLR